MTKRIPQKLKVELSSLVRQIAKARAVLANVKSQITTAKNTTEKAAAPSLVEVNEQLILAAMESRYATDSAMQALDALARSAQHDPLTNLPNRTMMHDRITQGIASAKRHDHCMAILFVDVDDFKSINDTLGHAAGDLVLKKISNRMVESVRDVDTVSRHGGDEFLILLPEIEHISDAALVAEKVSGAVGRSMVIGKGRLKVSISIGICAYPDHAIETDALIKCADFEMYKVKRARLR